MDKSWLDKIERLDQVPGWTCTTQHDCYKDIVQSLPKNAKILEIGCGWGRSTWAWLDCLPDDTLYYVLDNFSLPMTELMKAIGQPTKLKSLKYLSKHKSPHYQIFDKIIKQHKNYNIIKNVWNMSGEEWKRHLDYTENWDLVYLDDNHTYDTVSDWLERFKNVPIVCGDDYHPSWEGVITAVDEHVKNYNYKFTLLPGMFWVIQK